MAAPYFTDLFSIYTLFSCIKEIVQGLAVHYNISKCFMLIPRKELGNLLRKCV